MLWAIVFEDFSGVFHTRPSTKTTESNELNGSYSVIQLTIHMDSYHIDIQLCASDASLKLTFKLKSYCEKYCEKLWYK